MSNNKRNVFISTYDNEWKGVADVLCKRLSFNVVDLHGKEYGNFPTRRVLLKKEWENVKNLHKYLRKFNHSGIVICSNYAALYLLFLRKMRILKCDTLIWFGVYVHNPKMFSIIKRYLKVFIKKGDDFFKIVVFSKPEIKLYSNAFSLPKDNFLYIPYGEWNQDRVIQRGEMGDYFFSGGYANRDFVTLARLFQNKSWKLFIAASKANEDFVKYYNTTELSKNITVMWDIPVDEFNLLLQNCRAVILLMKYNTGASGQVVLLHALQYGKLIVASYTDVVDEYIRNDETGIVINEKTDESITTAMNWLNDSKNVDTIETITENGYQHYLDKFSYDAISNCLVKVISEYIQ